jgi:cobalt-zinc-cadmium efflux system outer membrane protein
MAHHHLVTQIVVVAVLCGCGPPVESQMQAPSLTPLATRAADADAIGSTTDGAYEVEGEPLDLPTALRLAYARSPLLAAARWHVASARGRLLQSGVRLNPELEIEVEEFGGSGGRSGSEVLASTIALSQEVETGQKRLRRYRIADIEAKTAGLDAEAARAELAAEVTVAFWSVCAAQERLALAGDMLATSERLFAAVEAKKAAGRATALECMQTEVIRAGAALDLARAARGLDAARRVIAGHWAREQPRFSVAAGPYYEMPEIPDLVPLLGAAGENAAVALGRVRIEAAQAALDLERANAMPNIRVGAGVQHFAESGDSSFIMAVGVPVPLFDTNRGNILAARAALERAYEEYRAAELATRASLRRSHEDLRSAIADAINVRDVILPVAERSFEVAQGGHEQGRYGYLDVLNARKTLHETRAIYIDAVASCWRSAAEVQKLSARAQADNSDTSRRTTGLE